MGKLIVAVIGAGNGGQAMAGHLGMNGHKVRLYNRTESVLEPIRTAGGIELKDAIQGFGEVAFASNDIGSVVKNADIIMVTTTADAHRYIAQQLAPHLEDGQIIVLNPGRTLGALEVRSVLSRLVPNKRLFVAEAQSLVYACRAERAGLIRVIGIKDRVLLAALPATDTRIVLDRLKSIYSCFNAAEHILITSLENIGAILHPAIVLFNAAAIERGNSFYFYNDMTPHVAAFLSKLDKERLAIGKAFDIELHNLEEWISFAYSNIEGDDLCSKMKNNPAYYKILAPQAINSRLLMEDIPTGILPMIELGKAAGIELPLMTSIFEIGQSLLEVDFKTTGRTLKSLDLSGKNTVEILRAVQ
jgi:opine dehydrogenase